MTRTIRSTWNDCLCGGNLQITGAAGKGEERRLNSPQGSFHLPPPARLLCLSAPVPRPPLPSLHQGPRPAPPSCRSCSASFRSRARWITVRTMPGPFRRPRSSPTGAPTRRGTRGRPALITGTGNPSALVQFAMRMNDRSPHEMQEDGFPPLWERFEQEYGDAYVRLANHLRERYPDITRKGRRTGRALRNICFFVWFYTRTGDREFIPTMLNASVLLSAQDDFYDNPRIPSVQKEAFCSAINHSIRTCAFHSATDNSRQVRELTSLWSVVARPIQRASPPVHRYWNEKACQLNEAMTAENRAIRRAGISFDEYMQTAVHSIGMAFVWSTYLVHKNVPISTIRDMHAILLQGARIARLSNDIASYRQGKNKRNAVILLGGGGSAERRIIQLMAQESRMFQKYLDALGVAPGVKRVMLRSTEFLKAFYQRSDFDKRALW